MNTPEVDGAAHRAAAIAENLFAAIAAGDAGAIRAAYTKDATIWNNHSPTTTGVDELIDMLEQMRGTVSRMWFEPVRNQATSTGFIDQHITHFVTKKGVTASLASCMIVDVREGLIYRVEEYSDPAEMSPVVAEMIDGTSD